MEKNQNEKYAILTDIHGLYEPLLAVLTDIKRRGISSIYVLGDSIGLGPNPNEVLSLLKKEDATLLMGNHEEYVKLGTDSFPYLKKLDHENIEFTKEQLSRENLSYLRTFPHFKSLLLNGKRIALCHFANDVRVDFMEHSTFTYQENVIEKTGHTQFNYTNSKYQVDEFKNAIEYAFLCEIESHEEKEKQWEVLERFVLENKESFPAYLSGMASYILDPLFKEEDKLLSYEDYDVLLQGHVHFPFHENTGKLDIYTLPSLALGRENVNLANYTILKEENSSCLIEQVQVPYNRKRMEKVINEKDFPKEKIKIYTSMK